MINPSRFVAFNTDSFTLLTNKLFTFDPLELPSSSNHYSNFSLDVTLLDRYLATASALIPQYYILSIQEACLSIVYLCKKNKLALENLCDYAVVSKSSALKGILEAFNSCSFDAIQMKVCFEEDILASLKTDGVFTCSLI